MGDVVMRVILIALLAAPLLAGAEALPSASNVLARVIARAQQTAGATETNHYVYEQRSVTTELDEKDSVIKSNEKLYRVKLVGGLPFPRLVKIHGRSSPAKELEKENERELAFRERMTRVDMKKKSRMKEGLVTADLVERFDFTVTRPGHGRGTPDVDFRGASPRAPTPRTSRWRTRSSSTCAAQSGWMKRHGASHQARRKPGRAVAAGGRSGGADRLPAPFPGDGGGRAPARRRVGQPQELLHIVARKLFSAIRLKTIEESSGFRRRRLRRAQPEETVRGGEAVGEALQRAVAGQGLEALASLRRSDHPLYSIW